MKNMANFLTVARILLSIMLLFLSPLSTVFFIVYLLCGFSDMIDGIVARRLGIASHFGALLDSIADIVFFVCAGVRIVSAIFSLFPSWSLYPVIAIVFVKLASLLAGYIKFRKPCFLHTYLCKTAGGLIFILPFFYQVQWFSVAVGIACTVAFIAAADEFGCVLKIKDYNSDCKGLLF